MLSCRHPAIHLQNIPVTQDKPESDESLHTPPRCLQFPLECALPGCSEQRACICSSTGVFLMGLEGRAWALLRASRRSVSPGAAGSCVYLVWGHLGS